VKTFLGNVYAWKPKGGLPGKGKTKKKKNRRGIKNEIDKKKRGKRYWKIGKRRECTESFGVLSARGFLDRGEVGNVKKKKGGFERHMSDGEEGKKGNSKLRPE